MLVAGANNFNQLDKYSNKKDAMGISVINPPCEFHIEPFFLSSFSTNGSHTVWITIDGKAYAIGDNRDGRICGSSEHLIFSVDNEIKIKSYKFISAVCGYYFTLYLVSDTENKLQLVYCRQSQIPNPIFLNIGNCVPQALFGGDNISGVIDKEGGIIVLTDSVFKSPKSKIKASFLPLGEKAVKLAFCNDYVIVLSSSGRVYESIIDKSPYLIFNEVVGLEKQKIVDISGVFEHCLAVTDDGKVYGRGDNASCKLGMPKEVQSIENFKLIGSLQKYKIVSVFTGSNQSVFRTDLGKMLVCGYNRCGQLFVSSNEMIYPPMEAEFVNDFSFCVCGGSSLAVFNSFIPKNIPNQKIENLDENSLTPSIFIDLPKQKKPNKIKKKDPKKSQIKDNIIENEENSDLKIQLSSLSLKVELLEKELSGKVKENSERKKENEKLKIENSDLMNVILKLENENSDLVKEKLKLENENSDLKKEKLKLENENSDLKKEVSNYKETQTKDKEQIENLKKKIRSESEAEKKQNISNCQPLPILDVSEIECLEKVKRIGRGATSEVFEVNRKERYALKILDNEINKDKDYEDEENEDKINVDFEKLKRFVRECEVLNGLDHPYIIKMHGFCYGDLTHEPAILLEYCPSNLKRRLKKLDDTDRSRIIVELSSAMNKIHSVGIIHRDLKLENILLDDDNHVRVSDFGLCTFIDNGDDAMSRTQMAGTLKFMAPELIQGRNDYDEKVDVYAFGVVVYLILTNGEYPKISIAEVGAGKKADIPESISKFSSELINSCWSFKSSDRPSFAEICKLLQGNEQKLI